ncbi:nucleotidyltransferase family protein [Phormidesmis priestleyi]
MNTTRPIELPYEEIIEFCRHYPIAKLSLFGSILRDDFKPDSDVDMLVEFTSDSKITYFDLVKMELELTEMVGRKVDLRTPNELSHYFRDAVLESAQPIYVQR